MKTAGTLQEFMEALVEQLSREPGNEEERQKQQRDRKLIRDAFIRMAGADPDDYPEEPGPAKIVHRGIPPGPAKIISF